MGKNSSAAILPSVVYIVYIVLESHTIFAAAEHQSYWEGPPKFVQCLQEQDPPGAQFPYYNLSLIICDKPCNGLYNCEGRLEGGGAQGLLERVVMVMNLMNATGIWCSKSAPKVHPQ